MDTRLTPEIGGVNEKGRNWDRRYWFSLNWFGAHFGCHALVFVGMSSENQDMPTKTRAWHPKHFKLNQCGIAGCGPFEIE